MRLLILSCNTGAGHNTCSGAISDIAAQYGDICDIEDALRFISSGTSKVMSGGHTRLYQHAPFLFREGYLFTEQHRELFKEDSPLYLFFAKASEKIYELCMTRHYDAILCPHPFSALIVSDMIKRYDFSAHPIKTFFLATDYTCSPGVDQSSLDAYFIPDPALTEEFASFGIPKERIFPFGIPIRSAFSHRIPRSDAKQSLGIPQYASHLLMMCGSMGCGPMKKIIDCLTSRLSEGQMLSVVCGTNKRLYRQLSERCEGMSSVRIYGYTTDIPRLMDSADLYLTKPGGLSVTEAASKQLPMVFVNAVAGCEDHNLRFFVSCKGAKTAESAKEIAALCLSLLDSSTELRQMEEALQNLRYGNAASLIYEKIRSMLLPPSYNSN